MITASECLKKFGEPLPENEGKYMVLWDVPDDINKRIPTIPNKIYCNKLMTGPLEKAFRNLMSYSIEHQLKTWDGCFNVRKKRGLGSLSLHSWGLAIDVNAAWNQLNQKPTLSSGFISSFTDAGFEWGGTWERKDGMHFQLKSL